MKARTWRRWLPLFIALALIAASCGDDGDSGGSGTTAAPGESKTPQSGGVITVGQFSAPPGLDPAKLAGGGTVGGMEHMALYDVLVRYNPETEEYEPRTAESLTSNDDFTEWTLKLRPGIKFTDGTDYDAEAVKFVHERQIAEGNPAAAGMFSTAVETFTVVDPLTIRYVLKKPWAGFGYVLAGVNGIIYSPTAFEKAGANFNAAPGDAGAGPFKLKTYSPGEVIEFERNPDYWGGPVYLDGLRFVLIPGPAQTYEALKAGTLQAGYVRDPIVVAKAREEGYQLINMPSPAGNMANMNSGVEVTCQGGKPDNLCAGKPDGEKVQTKTATSDVRVRRAVAHAVDPKVLNERVYEGKAKPNSAPFANSPWDPGVEGPKADPDLARQLVAEAKADGWDGKIRVLAGNDPTSSTWGQAVAAQLGAVGMDVSLDTGGDIQTVVQKVLVLRDFDVVTWAYGQSDESDGNYLQLLGQFGPKRYGYGPPEMIEAVDLLRVADDETKRTEAYRKISEIWVRDVPAHVITEIPQALVYGSKLHGPQRTAVASVLFDKAWLER